MNNCPADCGNGSNGGGGGGSNTGSGSGSATAPFCGDLMCNGTETAATCSVDCQAQGSGGGSGALDCSDFTVLFACVTCIGDATMCVGVTQADCSACLGGI